MRKFYHGESSQILEHLEPEITGMKEEITRTQNQPFRQNCKELVSKYGQNFLFVCAFLALFQFTGIGGIMYFSQQITESAGFGSGQASNISAMVLFLIGAMACLLNMRIIDSYGRRWILLTMIPFQGLSILLMGVGMWLGTYSESQEPAKWLCLVALVLYFWFVNLGNAPLSGVVPPELFPVTNR
jgi:MFS family permease